MLDARQRQIAARVRDGGPGALLLSEVSSVVTVGRRTPDVDVSAALKGGTERHEVDRGGLATWHGPGQWVLFMVDRLERLTGDPRGVRKMIELLLAVALEVARAREPESRARTGAELGVWTPRGKCAAVGIHVEHGVVLHGLSLNGYATPSSFKGLRPCGLDAPVDYLVRGEEEFLSLGRELAESSLIQLSKVRCSSTRGAE